MTTATTISEPDTLADAIRDLGDVPLDRILWTPRPGTATEADLMHFRVAGNGRRLELVDGVLMEKPMGARESYLAFTLMYFLGAYQRSHNIGVFGAPDAIMRLRPELLRIPDIHFTSWANLPSDAAHMRPVADYPPDLAVEILSESDRPGMMARKRREYFNAGTRVVWVVDPLARLLAVYADPADPDAHTTLTAADTLTGEPVLPGFALPLAELFDDPQLNPRR